LGENDERARLGPSLDKGEVTGAGQKTLCAKGVGVRASLAPACDGLKLSQLEGETRERKGPRQGERMELGEIQGDLAQISSPKQSGNISSRKKREGDFSSGEKKERD